MKMANPILTAGLALFSLQYPGYSSGIVNEPSEAALRAALEGGGSVVFACDGTITIASTLVITSDTTLDASGHSLALSGDSAVRVLQVKPGVSFTATHLTFANGQTNRGAGILNDGGFVTMVNCALLGNKAVGTNGLSGISDPLTPGEPGFGGAIWNSGIFIATDTAFRTNSVLGGRGSSSGTWAEDGGAAHGGAIYSTGSLFLTNCLFEAGLAQGGQAGEGVSGGRGGQARGGAILNDGGSLTASECHFVTSASLAGFHNPFSNFGYRGNASGGAIHNQGPLLLVRTHFSSNSVSGTEALGGGLAHFADSASVQGGSFDHNSALGDRVDFEFAADGGPGGGGAIFNSAVALITDLTCSFNSASGGPGSGGTLPFGPEPMRGGNGFGGAVLNRGNVQIHRCTFQQNQAIGGIGTQGYYRHGAGGVGSGGAIFSTAGSVLLVNSTLYANVAKGGRGADGWDNWVYQGYEFPPFGGVGGLGIAGALSTTNTSCTLNFCTIIANTAVGGPGGKGKAGYPDGAVGPASIGGLHAQGTNVLSLLNSIVARSTPTDLSGTVVGAPNLIGGDPRLSPLADNGGSTWTMALLQGSPAINTAANLPAVDTDQRGVPRPYGSLPDLGAYEWNGTNFPAGLYVTLTLQTAGQYKLQVAGPPNQSFRLCTSTNLSDWLDLSTNTTDPQGLFETTATPIPGSPLQFFRALAP